MKSPSLSFVPPVVRFTLAAGLAVFAAAGLACAQPSPASTSDSTPLGRAPGGPAADGALTLVTRGSIAGKTRLKSGGAASGESGVDEVHVSLRREVPLPLDADGAVGIDYRHTAFDSASAANVSGVGAAPLPECVQSLSLGVSYRRAITGATSLLLRTDAGYHAVGDAGLTADGFGVNCVALALHRSSPTLHLAGGLAYSSLATGVMQVLPVVGIDWQPAPRWSLALGFPKTGVSYRCSQAFRLALLAEGTGGTYYVEKDPQPGARGRPALHDTTIEFYDVRVGLAAEWTIRAGLRATASVGSVVGREFDYHERHFTLKSDGTAAYFSCGVTATF